MASAEIGWIGVAACGLVWLRNSETEGRCGWFIPPLRLKLPELVGWGYGYNFVGAANMSTLWMLLQNIQRGWADIDLTDLKKPHGC